MFDPTEIDTELLVQEVPYLSMIEKQDYDWDDLGDLLNLQIQGLGPRNAAPPDEPPMMGFQLLPKDYWSSVKTEVFTLLCTEDAKYAEIRDRLSKHSGTATLYILSTLSVWLSSLLGASLAMITPLVGTVLYAIAKLGVGGWCESERQSRKKV
jgi:hypothetical protein